MANTAHLVCRQSSRDLKPQRSVDRLEMKEMRSRLVVENQKSSSAMSYGATNAGFDDSSPNTKNKLSDEGGGSKLGSTEVKAIFRPEAGEDERENWDSKLTFLLATVGYAVGLGNVWRFPYLAQKNGGGAFLIPYFVMLAIEGIPIFYLELAIGQRLRKGAIGVWNQVSPYLAGIGVSSAVVSFNVALYYNTIIAWCLFYLAQSFQSELPWSECPNKYFQNGSYASEPECLMSGPTQYFWYRTTLMISEDINSPEVFNWKIALALVVAWILVYMCMIKGIASSGKVVYVTATFPYMVLIIFFFRGVTLPGMSDGLRHLFTPKWWTLTDPVVWLEAGTQIFFSLGLAFGGLIAFSSYNPVNNNCYRDAITVSLTNCFTSMFAGIVVFSIIGFKATMVYEQCLVDRNATLVGIFGNQVDVNNIPPPGAFINVPSGHGSLDNIIMPELPVCDLEKELDNSASGTGLAFIIFTEAINQFPGAQFWSVLFFLMLFTLGIDSQFGTLEGVVTSIVDMKIFPNLRKEILTGVICLACCIISMGFAHGAGSYVFVLFDNFSGNFPLLIIAFFECIGVSYVYGLKRFADDIELMTGNRPGLYWLICWKYLSPLAMLSILVASFVEIAVDGSGYPAWIASKGITEIHEWPLWALLLIAFLISASVLWIPGVALCRYFGILIIDDNEKAWFPAADLKEFHGIVPHEVTASETLLFCIRSDGSEGLCCPTGGSHDDDDDLT
ncbi:sodium-dependent neutral amino acid transporter B(0)AT3 isoform X1 [Neodiprion pinetum]|uniref:Transporter n=1 Tax=Neodiprion lecontei TaxID=441921 RepID=A0ABM3FET7_NEOLC|nr:sodium-dependent neutral amino acid transporter B(0)AT3 [Neodiprion pinetum]XP_046586530.1 sodium-dependent neutral amino acid transporter B(0)AT3 [Neodiprion lecontei]